MPVSSTSIFVGECLRLPVDVADGLSPTSFSILHYDGFEVLPVMDWQSIDQLAQRLVALVPPGLAEVQKDLYTNLRDALVQGLHRLDLVTREEFDVQRQLLLRTRMKLEALERRLAELEAAWSAQNEE
jgi:ubiquinone biosynthesis accessory factor UbiK